MLLAEHEPAMLKFELPKPHGTEVPGKIQYSEIWTITSTMSPSLEHCLLLKDAFHFMGIEITVADLFIRWTM
jgi:hypothetical protein